jgi:hypothetical protein
MNKLLTLGVGLILNIFFSFNIILNIIPIIQKLQLGGIIYQDNGVPQNIHFDALFYIFITIVYFFLSAILFSIFVKIFKSDQKVLPQLGIFTFISIVIYFIVKLLQPFYKVTNTVYDNDILGFYIYLLIFYLLFLIYSIVTFIKTIKN